MAPSCKGCGAEIIWVKTESGKDMPVNPSIVTVIAENEGKIVRGYIPHWSTCPKASQFKQTKKD